MYGKLLIIFPVTFLEVLWQQLYSYIVVAISLITSFRNPSPGKYIRPLHI